MTPASRRTGPAARPFEQGITRPPQSGDQRPEKTCARSTAVCSGKVRRLMIRIRSSILDVRTSDAHIRPVASSFRRAGLPSVIFEERSGRRGFCRRWRSSSSVAPRPAARSSSFISLSVSSSPPAAGLAIGLRNRPRTPLSSLSRVIAVTSAAFADVVRGSAGVELFLADKSVDRARHVEQNADRAARIEVVVHRRQETAPATGSIPGRNPAARPSSRSTICARWEPPGRRSRSP